MKGSLGDPEILLKSSTGSSNLPPATKYLPFTLLGLIPNSWFSALLVALVSFGGILNILLKHAIRSSDSGQNSSKLPPRAGVPSLISADRKSTNSNRSAASVLCLILVGLFIVAATVRHLRGLGCDV